MKKDEAQLNDEKNMASRSAGRPVSQILHEILAHLTEIIRSELQLARTEIRQDLARLGQASALLAIGAVFGLYALGFILLAALYLLATTISLWLAALAMGIGVGIVAAIFLQLGRQKLRLVSLKPNKTIRSLEENVTWMKRQTK